LRDEVLIAGRYLSHPHRSPEEGSAAPPELDCAKPSRLLIGGVMKMPKEAAAGGMPPK
jgi:hypothetical protein